MTPLKPPPHFNHSEPSRLNKLETFTLGVLRRVLGSEVEIVSQAVGLPGTPDFFIPSLRLVVMVDGDFWHPGRREKMLSLGLRLIAKGEAERGQFWLEKASANRARDKELNKELKAMGLAVVRLKESRLNSPQGALGYVSRAIALSLGKF